MTGVEMVGALLGAHVPLIAVVPANRMAGGRLPQGITLPAIVATRISMPVTSRLSGRASMAQERVQVTVYAPDYVVLHQVLSLVLTACDGRSGTVAGVANAAVTALGGGPDFTDDAAAIWMGSHDFRVSYPL